MHARYEADGASPQAAPTAGGWFYPRFNGAMDLGLFRLGGSGLANALYTWAKSLVLARNHGGANVFPTWPQVKIGPLLRREPDPRHYIGLFRPVSGDIAGVRKLALLAAAPRSRLSRLGDDLVPGRRLHVVSDAAFNDHFEELLSERDFLKGELARRSVKLPSPPGAPFIGIHIRFGDFTLPKTGELTGAVNHRLPLEWYAGRLDAIRQAIGRDAPAMIFSDAAPDELAPILAKPRVTLQQGGTALDDLWRLSQASVIIASASTYSYWAGYLGEGVVVSRAGAWRTQFDCRPREWICAPEDTVLPPELLAAARRAGL
jgi:hypothetical protein